VVLGQMTDTCEVLGRMSSTEITYIDNNDQEKGIKITYNKGHLIKLKEIFVQTAKFLLKTAIQERPISTYYATRNRTKISFSLNRIANKLQNATCFLP
jgi:hypothetical protein